MILSLFLLAQLELGRCRMITAPERVVRDGCESTRVSYTYDRCHYGDRATDRRLNAILENTVRRRSNYDHADDSACVNGDGDEPREHHFSSSCDRPFVHGSLVSVSCVTEWSAGAHPGAEIYAINLVVEEGEYRELSCDAVVVDPVAFWALVRSELEALVEKCAEDEEERTYLVESVAEQYVNVESFSFTPVGMTLTYDHGAMGYCVIIVDLPYQKLHGVLDETLIPRTPSTVRR